MTPLDLAFRLLKDYPAVPNPEDNPREEPQLWPPEPLYHPGYTPRSLMGPENEQWIGDNWVLRPKKPIQLVPDQASMMDLLTVPEEKFENTLEDYVKEPVTLNVMNPESRLYHPQVTDEHANEELFPDRVEYMGMKEGQPYQEELVSSNPRITEEYATFNELIESIGEEKAKEFLTSSFTKPEDSEYYFNNPNIPMPIAPVPKGTFQGLPFREETGFTRSEPMDLAMRLLKSPLDLLSAEELFELSAFGTDDPELVEMHLGEHRTLTPEEAEDISWRAVDAQEAEGEASHPEGMSHEENVKQFRGRGGRPVNWGLGVQGGFGIEDEEGEIHWEKPPPTISPATPSEPVFIPPGPKSPEIIANQPWPMGFTTENKSEPMDIAFQMLKAPYLPESFTPIQQEFQMPNQKHWAKDAVGIFAHPEDPDEQYQMSISYMGGNNPYVEVKHPASGETIAHGTFRYEPHPYDEEEPGHIESDDTWVHKDHRRKAMGPAMYYFLVNQMERLWGPELRSSEHMTDEGKKMWEREQGTAEPGTSWKAEGATSWR